MWLKRGEMCGNDGRWMRDFRRSKILQIFHLYFRARTGSSETYPFGEERQFDLPNWGLELLKEGMGFHLFFRQRLLRSWKGSGVDCYCATPDSCMVSGEVGASLKI